MKESEKIEKDFSTNIKGLKKRIEELETALVECKLSEDSLKKSEKNLLSLLFRGRFLSLSSLPCIPAL